MIRFLSTPSARRATTAYPTTCVCAGISIHALREEGDFPAWSNPKKLTAFLSTPSSRRATRLPRQLQKSKRRFLSTPSSRRATDIDEINTHIHKLFLSTPSSRRATAASAAPFGGLMISIHALLTEGDINVWKGDSERPNFYPRPPHGGRLLFR